MPRYIISLFFILIFQIISFAQDYGQKIDSKIFQEAQGFPKDEMFGNYDYLIFKIDNDDYIIKNKENINLENYKEFKLSTQKGYIIIYLTYLKENNYIYFFYYQSNADYGGSSLCKFDLNTKKIIWNAEVHTLNPGRPVLTNDGLYLSGYEIMYKIDKNSGKTLWTLKYPVNGYILDTYAPAEVYENVVVYKDRSKHHIYLVIDKKNGKLLNKVE